MQTDTPSQTPPTLRLGTRGSRLALAQSELAAAALRAAGNAVDIVVVKTSGDRIKDKPLADFGGKALFAKELEEALLTGTIDLAVHSLKDLPAALPQGLGLTAVLARATPFDPLVLPQGVSTLPAAPRIGTCSVRRGAQARRSFRGATIHALRGNVDTRLAHLDDGQFDAVILSAAGLGRLGLQGRVGRILSGETWLPALGQGAIGIETRDDDARTNAAVANLDDAASRLAVTCERAFQSGLNGNCHSPIAGLAEIAESRLRFRGEVLAPDGSDHVAAAFGVELTGTYAHDLAAVAEKAFAAGSTLRPRAEKWL